MAFARRNQNRRRIDAAQRQEALTEGVRVAAPPILRVLGVLTLGAAAVVGAVEGRAWTLSSPRFAVSRVDFSGVTRTVPTDLARAAGLERGTNIFQLDVAAAERALQAQPWVRQATVTRRLPDEVHVHIVEHVAVAMASLGDLYLVNDQGEPFKKVTPSRVSGDRLDLPLLTGIAREAYVRDPQGTAQRFHEAIALVQAYEASGAAQRGRLSEVRIEPGTRVAVTETAQEIRFGDGATDDALRRLFQVRRELARHGLVAQVIHLDNRTRPDRVAVKLEDQIASSRE